MRNNIKSIIILILIVLLIIIGAVGIKIGNFKILSISELIDKNEQVDNKILEATTLSSINYPETIDKLEQTYEKYVVQKQKYEEVSGFTKEDKKEIYETKKYDIVYLWQMIGNYAKKYNLTINMEVQQGSTQNLYNLNFNVSGQYANITKFIASIENNSDLYFRIYNFKMTGNEVVGASFTVKDVSIDPSTITTITTVTTQENSDNAK